MSALDGAPVQQHLGRNLGARVQEKGKNGRSRRMLSGQSGSLLHPHAHTILQAPHLLPGSLLLKRGSIPRTFLHAEDVHRCNT